MGISKENLIALDLETYLIAPGIAAPRPVCMSLADSEGAALYHRTEMAPTLAHVLQPGVYICGANIAFDFACIMNEWPHFTGQIFDKYERGEVFDVLIAAALDSVAYGLLLKEPDGSPLKKANGSHAGAYSLEIVTRLYTGRTNAKENDAWRMRYGQLDATPIDLWPAEARQYPIDDVRNTFDVAVKQIAAGKNLGLIDGKTWTHQTHQARAAFAMHLGAVWGLRTDPVRVAELEQEILAKCADGEATSKALGFMRHDGSEDSAAVKRAVVLAYGGSPDAACAPCQGTGKVVSEVSGNPINCKACSATGLALPEGFTCVTQTGGVKTDRDTKAESGDEALMTYAQVSEYEKLRDTYLPFLKDGIDKPINVRPNVLVESGRASYFGLIQLLPREHGVRTAFIFGPGRVGCSCDYAALELCTLAQVNLHLPHAFSDMAEVINAQGDPGLLHSLLAAEMVGQDPGQFLELLAAEDETAVHARQGAKAGNFGFPGFMGAAKLVVTKRKEGLRFCQALKLAERCGEEKVTQWRGRPTVPICKACVEGAEKIKKAFFGRWREMKSFLAWVSSLDGFESKTATIVSPGSGYVRGGIGTNGANHPFQHLAAMGAKHALWKVTREAFCDRTSPLYGTRPVVFAHDEILADMPEDKAHLAAPRMSEIMVDAMREFVPDVAIKSEPALMRRWYKGAKPVRDAEGKLIPWEPKPKEPRP